VIDPAEVRRSCDLVEVVQGYVKLRKSGSQYVGLCPFHKEKSPSFYVHPEKQLYHCHGCGAGGDAIRFLERIEGVDFPKAMRMLAERAGLNIKPMTAADRRAYAATRERIEEAAYFAVREGLRVTEPGVLLEMYRERCAADPEYQKRLLNDRRNAEEMTAALIAILATAQERESAGAAA
jgi:DNA primase